VSCKTTKRKQTFVSWKIFVLIEGNRGDYLVVDCLTPSGPCGSRAHAKTHTYVQLAVVPVLTTPTLYQHCYEKATSNYIIRHMHFTTLRTANYTSLGPSK